MLTPEDALKDCIRALPAFGAYWDSEDSYRWEDGSFSACGVYTILTRFLREHWRELAESDWRALAALASDHFRRADDPSSEIGPCFIEGLEGEDYSPIVARHFEPALLQAFGFMA